MNPFYNYIFLYVWVIVYICPNHRTAERQKESPLKTNPRHYSESHSPCPSPPDSPASFYNVCVEKIHIPFDFKDLTYDDPPSLL